MFLNSQKRVSIPKGNIMMNKYTYENKILDSNFALFVLQLALQLLTECMLGCPLLRNMFLLPSWFDYFWVSFFKILYNDKV